MSSGQTSTFACPTGRVTAVRGVHLYAALPTVKPGTLQGNIDHGLHNP